MADIKKFYVNGDWVAPIGHKLADVINPSTGKPMAQVAIGNAQDANNAIAAASAAFPQWSKTSRAERLSYLHKINQGLIDRNDEIATVISNEMGAPKSLSESAQAPSGSQHFSEILRLLPKYAFTENIGSTLLSKEPIGVCALITPWNWPINQIACKVAPALAAGCTMVLKPSEFTPSNAAILAEIIDDAGLPAGVFNLVHGDGELGSALTGHDDVDMVSFTGSTRAGVAISQNAAPTIKRVALELGGKSANIILPDTDLSRAIPASVTSCMTNSGQSCNAPTRLMVHRDQYDKVCEIAKQASELLSVGAPLENCSLGPIANANQYTKVKFMIDQAIKQGAALISGGNEIPLGLNETNQNGFFIRPTILGAVTADMTIAKEEVFGPVLCIMIYDDVEEAITIANDSEYGLSGYVWGEDIDKVRAVALQLRTGMVHLNGAPLDAKAPFGGYRQSGNGREWGVYGLEEFLEIKSIYGGS